MIGRIKVVRNDVLTSYTNTLVGMYKVVDDKSQPNDPLFGY